MEVLGYKEGSSGTKEVRADESVTQFVQESRVAVQRGAREARDNRLRALRPSFSRDSWTKEGFGR